MLIAVGSTLIAVEGCVGSVIRSSELGLLARWVFVEFGGHHGGAFRLILLGHFATLGDCFDVLFVCVVLVEAVTSLSAFV